MIQVHEDAILVPQLVHDVLVRVSVTINQNRLECRLWLLLEYLHDVFGLNILRTGRLDDVLEGGEHLVHLSEDISW